MATKTQAFEDEVERALQQMLHDKLDHETRVKLINVCVRWAAVKNKLVLPEHGSGFEDED